MKTQIKQRTPFKESGNLLGSLKVPLFLVLLSIFPDVQYASQPEPRFQPSKVLICSESEFDAGVVKLGQNYQVTHRFHLKNIGDEDVVLSRIEASCTCANATPETKVIKKGTTSFIDVVINVSPTDFRGVSAKIAIATSHGVVDLHFKATPEFEPYIIPRELHFGRNAFGRKARQKFHVVLPSYQRNEKFLESIKNESNLLSIRVIDQQCQRHVDKKDKEYFVYLANVEATLDLTSQKSDGKTRISVILSDKRELELDVNWTAPDKEIFLPSICLLPSQSKEPFEIQVMYNSLFGGAVKDVKFIGEGMKIKNMRESPPYYIFDLECHSLASILHGKTVLFIKTHSGEEHKLPFVIAE